MKAIVDQDTCTGCRICWASCPDSCIEVHAEGRERVSINLDYCKGCGICWEVCPLHCIEAKEEIDFERGIVRITY